MWTYNNKEITGIDDIENSDQIVGFVYKITNLIDGRIYIGKKSLRSSRKTKIGVREKALTKTRKVYKTVVKESNWMTYWGSCEELKDDLKELGKASFKREIVEFCCSKKYMTYLEMSMQVHHDVLNTDSYNSNILARYFRKDMQKCNFNLITT